MDDFAPLVQVALVIAGVAAGAWFGRRKTTAESEHLDAQRDEIYERMARVLAEELKLARKEIAGLYRANHKQETKWALAVGTLERCASEASDLAAEIEALKRMNGGA